MEKTMPIDKATVMAQIDDVLKCGSATEESVTLACAALKRDKVRFLSHI
jgi:hypothetical protein